MDALTQLVLGVALVVHHRLQVGFALQRWFGIVVVVGGRIGGEEGAYQA